MVLSVLMTVPNRKKALLKIKICQVKKKYLVPTGKPIMEEPAVLVIIVTYNKKKYVTNLLKSLRDIQYKNLDILVLDNASKDGTYDYLRQTFSEVVCIRNRENLGGSGGFNTGFRYAFEQEKYKYLWLLDDDVVVAGNSLKNLVDVLEKNDDIAVAGSQMCQLDNPEVTNEVGAYVNLDSGSLILNRHLTRRINNSAGIFDVDYVAAASMLVDAAIAKKAGFMEDFFIHFDDVDWCLRIKKMGYKVVGVADSVIWHLSAAEKPVTWQQYYDVRNMLFLLKKHASQKAVSRFIRRKCLQAKFLELKGLTSVAEIILEAIDDFCNGKKGRKIFHLPENISEKALKNTHPKKGVFVCPNEWFDLQKFPFEEKYIASITGLMIPEHLVDSVYYWKRNYSIPLKSYVKIVKIILIAAGLIGYRRYERAYVEIRGIPFISAALSNELIVKINDNYWKINRDRLSVWKSSFYIFSKSIKLYMMTWLSKR